MKKSLCASALLFLFLSGSLLAQSEFWAAKKLSEVFTEKNKENLKIPENQAYAIITEAVKDYLDALKLNDGYIENNLANTNERKPDVDAIKNKIREYLNFILEEKPIRLMSDQEIKLLIESFSPVSTTSSGFSITNLADGMAKFLVERTKEELNAAFFVKFKEVITSKKYAYLKDLFLQTYSLLISISDQIYDYRSYIQRLKAAFIGDLNSISFKVIPFLLNENYFNFENELRPGLKELLLLANSTFEKIVYSSDHPGAIIEAIDVSQITEENCVIRGCLKTVQIISKSLRNKKNADEENKDEKYWIEGKEIINYFWNDKYNFITLRIYLNLLKLRLAVIKGENVIVDRDLYLLSIFEKLGSEINIDVLRSIKNICLRAMAVDEALAIIRQKSDKATIDDYHKLYGAILDTLETVQEFYQYLIDKKDQNKEVQNLRRFFVTARALGDIALSVKQKNYASIGNHIVLILDKVFSLSESEEEGVLSEVKGKITKAIGGNDPQNEAILKDVVKEIDKLRNSKAAKNSKVISDLARTIYDNRKNKIIAIKNVIARYVPFICAVANAENSTQIKEAIEAIVLPAGSSNIKKTTPFNLALNAYVGGSFGVERNSEQNGDSLAGSVYGPIGLAFSFGSSKNHDSLSIFMPVVDLGALVSYRFTSQENEGLAQFVFKNIISPGLYFVYGFRGVPVSIGLGIHQGPELVEITNQSATLKTRPWRVGFFLAVDIPLINFWTAFPN